MDLRLGIGTYKVMGTLSLWLKVMRTRIRMSDRKWIVYWLMGTVIRMSDTHSQKCSLQWQSNVVKRTPYSDFIFIFCKSKSNRTLTFETFEHVANWTHKFQSKTWTLRSKFKTWNFLAKFHAQHSAPARGSNVFFLKKKAASPSFRPSRQTRMRLTCQLTQCDTAIIRAR